MKSPRWHYAEAERLLELADAEVSENWAASTGEHKADVIAAAHVHAILSTANPGRIPNEPLEPAPGQLETITQTKDRL